MTLASGRWVEFVGEREDDGRNGTECQVQIGVAEQEVKSEKSGQPKLAVNPLRPQSGYDSISSCPGRGFTAFKSHMTTLFCRQTPKNVVSLPHLTTCSSIVKQCLFPYHCESSFRRHLTRTPLRSFVIHHNISQSHHEWATTMFRFKISANTEVCRTSS